MVAPEFLDNPRTAAVIASFVETRPIWSNNRQHRPAPCRAVFKTSARCGLMKRVVEVAHIHGDRAHPSTAKTERYPAGRMGWCADRGRWRSPSAGVYG